MLQGAARKRLVRKYGQFIGRYRYLISYLYKKSSYAAEFTHEYHTQPQTTEVLHVRAHQRTLIVEDDII